MPTYEVQCNCEGGHVREAWFPIKEGVPTICPDCGGTMVQHLPSPPIHGVGASGARRSWREGREKDTEAYKRLRRDGVQPRGVTGAAEIEVRAGTRYEVENDRVFEDRKLAARVDRGVQEVASA
jgi:predicted nucleic acid-binding Zn ribbon protein